jgi:hypothetical protein
MALAFLAAGYVLGAAMARAKYDDRCALCGMLRRRIEDDDERG